MPSLASLIARAQRSLGDHLGRLGRSFDSLAGNHRVTHDRRTGARPRPPAPCTIDSPKPLEEDLQWRQ
jgi:hypothetical protein